MRDPVLQTKVKSGKEKLQFCLLTSQHMCTHVCMKKHIQIQAYTHVHRSQCFRMSRFLGCAAWRILNSLRNLLKGVEWSHMSQMWLALGCYVKTEATSMCVNTEFSQTRVLNFEQTLKEGSIAEGKQQQQGWGHVPPRRCSPSVHHSR